MNDIEILEDALEALERAREVILSVSATAMNVATLDRAYEGLAMASKSIADLLNNKQVNRSKKKTRLR